MVKRIKEDFTMARTKRYCLDPNAIQLLQRDGIGWGHDLDCGCFQHETLPRRGLWVRMFGKRDAQ